MGWQKLAFEQVNEYSSIPRSIGDSAKVKKKTPESVIQEYDVEKWGALKELSQNLSIIQSSSKKPKYIYFYFFINLRNVFRA